MGPELIAAAIAAGGAVMQNQAANDDRKERRTILNRQLERDDKASDQATQMVQQEGQRFSQQARQEGLQGQEDKAYAQTQADLQGAGGAMLDTAGDSGAVSQEFLDRKGQRINDESTRLSSIAQAASKARAPGMLDTEDALGRANLAGSLQNIWGKTRNMQGATGLDAQNLTPSSLGTIGRVASAIAPAAGGMMGGGSGISWDADGSYGRKYALGAGR